MKRTNAAIALFAAAAMVPLALFAAQNPATVLNNLHGANQMEIHMGELAKDKAQSADVKQYAETLVNDHTSADDKVRALAQQQNISLDPVVMSKDGQKTYDKLKSQTGKDFDKTFVKAMIADHKDAVKMVESAQKELTDSPVGQLAGELLPTLQAHLKTAEDLQTQLMKSPNAG